MADISPINHRLDPVLSPRRVRKYDGRKDDDEKHRRRNRRKSQRDSDASTDTLAESCETGSGEYPQKNRSRNPPSETDDQPGGHVDVRV